MITRLPIRSPAARAGRDALRPRTRAPATTSSSSISGTGLKKCMPTTRSGRAAAAASAVTGSEDVFVASTASASQISDRRANSSRFSSRSSGAASITSSQRAEVLERGRGVEATLGRRGGARSDQRPRSAPLRSPSRTLLEAALERLRERVVKVGLEAAEAGDLGDAGAHRAGAGDAEHLDLAQLGPPGRSPSQ